MNGSVNSDFKIKYMHTTFPFYAAWHYDIKNNGLHYIGNTRQYPQLTYITILGQLINSVKPCFSGAYRGILDLLTENSPFFLDNQNKTIYVSLLLPFKFGNEYTLTKQVIVPNFENGTLTEFVIISHPVRDYGEDPFLVEIHTSNNYDSELTLDIKNELDTTIVFSKRQKKVIDLISKGLSSADIAEYLDRCIPAVYKMNRKILEKISDYYQLKFNSVKDAVTFHEQNFV